MQWLLQDDAANTAVGGTIAGVLAGGNTEDVQATIHGHGSFHLDGATQYVSVNINPTLIPASERANLWTKHASNPVIGDGVTPVMFGQVVANPGGGWWFYGCKSGDVYRWASSDLVTWTDETEVFSAAPGEWDNEIQVVLPIRKLDGNWVMFYRGNGSGGLQIGRATSADGTTWARQDNGGVDDGLFDQFGTNFDPTACILIDGVYHVYVNGYPDHDHTNLYTSSDLVTFTAYENNPIFNNGFCGTVWKYGGSYYMLICRDLYQAGSTLYDHGLALYRCADPYFEYGVREHLGYAAVNDQSYDDRYLDTPSVPMTDVERDTYPAEFGDTLYAIYTGDLGGATQNLITTSLSGLASLPAIEETASERYYYAARTFVGSVQFDTLSDNDMIFSIGDTLLDSSPVQLWRVVSSGLSIYLAGGWRSIAATFSAGVPYQIVVVDDIGETRVFVNGDLKTALAFKNISTHANYLYIGNGESGQSVDGYMWGWRVYNSALTAKQVEQLYATGRI